MAPVAVSVVNGRTRGNSNARAVLQPGASGDVANSIGKKPIKKVCCVGAGYVGGPTASVIAYTNPDLQVTVVDLDVVRIRRWNSRHPPIYEPGLHDIVRVARDGARPFKFSNKSEGEEAEDGVEALDVPVREPNLFFSTDVAGTIAEADVVLIAVNTPTKYRGIGAGSATDMTAFEAVTGVVAQHARPGAIIVEKSTVPVRTAQLVHETLSMHRPGVHFEIVSNPEFLAAGTAVNDLLYPDRILIGSDPTPSGQAAAEVVANIYASWIPRSRIITTNVWSSELAKLVANSMLAQRISSINSISAVCEKTGADVDEVAKAIGVDPRIGDKFLRAGIGFGGSCFKKDILNLVYLAESCGLEEVGEYWRQVVKMNDYARDRFSNRVIRCLNNTLVGKKITILGYAFKKNTSDTREAPALEMIKTLLEERPREIAVFDPCCNPIVVKDEITAVLGSVAQSGSVVVYGDGYEACNGSTAIVIATEFDEFSNKKPRTPPASPATTKNKKTKPDPRPFVGAQPAAIDLLSLHKFLVQTSDGDDPMNRFNTEPDCPLDCPDCRREVEARETGHATGMGSAEEYRPKERLDWAAISASMSKPKWLFDGRGVIDAKEITRLGIRFESVGRQSGF
jgi:UDPglucose 6-dehydrogenase